MSKKEEQIEPQRPKFPLGLQMWKTPRMWQVIAVFERHCATMRNDWYEDHYTYLVEYKIYDQHNMRAYAILEEWPEHIVTQYSQGGEDLPTKD